MGKCRASVFRLERQKIFFILFFNREAVYRAVDFENKGSSVTVRVTVFALERRFEMILRNHQANILSSSMRMMLSCF